MAFLMIPLVPAIMVLSTTATLKYVKKLAKDPSKLAKLVSTEYNLDDYKATDCIPGKWDTEWSPCSKSCGGGFQTLKRRNDILEKNGGGACAENILYTSCNLEPCANDCKPSPYTIIPKLPPATLDWEGRYEGWSQCDATQCDEYGWQYKYRDTQYDIPRTEGGGPCPPIRNQRKCITPCPNPDNFLSDLSKENIVSGDTPELLHQLYDILQIVSFEYKYPSSATNKEMILKKNLPNGYYGWFETSKRPDGKYQIHISDVADYISIPALVKIYDGVPRGSNRMLVMGYDVFDDLVTVEFLPNYEDSIAGVPIEMIKFKRVNPYE